MEATVARRLPRVIVVGLPASSVRESVERVRSAIVASGFQFPRGCVTVNLAPSGIRKEGTGLDVAIAVGILAAAGELRQCELADVLLAGELGLQGDLKAVPGTLALAVLARQARIKRLVVPVGCGSLAANVEGVEVFEASSLVDVVALLHGRSGTGPCDPAPLSSEPHEESCESVLGQPAATRAVELSAAGGHSLMLSGPPGVGKTMLAKRLVGLLPDLALAEALEVAQIHSRIGSCQYLDGLPSRPPFRNPHHTISKAGLLGSARLLPGEVSLAHRGVLLLDELPEFSRAVLETLRGPLEDRLVRVSRARGVVCFPAVCILVATANPCPCGYLGHPSRACSCTDGQVHVYRRRISGPLLDRIDLRVDMEQRPLSAPNRSSLGEHVSVVRKRIGSARRLQALRSSVSGASTNAECSPAYLLEKGGFGSATKRSLEKACDSLSLSARARVRLVRVARTVADLDGSEKVGPEHLAEALSFRGKSWGQA